MHAFITWAALVSGFWVLFAVADDHLPTEARAQVGHWLFRQGPREYGLTTFVTVCDHLFGTPTVSGRGFLRVGVAAQAVTMLLWGLASVLYPGTSVPMVVLLTLYAPWVIGALALVNLLPGYLIWLAGRAVLRWTSRAPTLGHLVVGLAWHGMLTVAMSTGMSNWTGIFAGTTIALLEQNIKYTGAVKFGDTVHLEMEVTEKKETSKSDKGIINIAAKMLNDAEQVVVDMKWTLMMKRKP